MLIEDNNNMIGIINTFEEIPEDMCIHGKYNGEVIDLVLLRPSDHPDILNFLKAFKTENKNVWNVISYDSDGCCLGNYSMCLQEKNIDKEIKEKEMQELLYKFKLYKNTYEERLQVAQEYSGDKDSQKRYEKRLREQDKIHYYL